MSFTDWVSLSRRVKPPLRSRICRRKQHRKAFLGSTFTKLNTYLLMSLYQSYLRSEHWRLLRGAKLQMHPRCHRCGSKEEIEVHHKVYRESWYDAQLKDLETLCHHCHTTHHAVEASKGQITHKAIKKAIALPKPIKQIVHRPPPKVKELIPELKFITWANKEKFKITKESYAWLASKGLGPDIAGWRRRIVGHVCPRHFLA